MLRSRLAERSLLRNSGFIMLTTGVNSGLGYVFWILAAHRFAPREVGVAGALIASMTFVAALANLGTSPALIERLPRSRSATEWSRILTTSFATGAGAGLVVALLAATLILPKVSSQLALVGSSPGFVLLFGVSVSVWSLCSISDYLFIAERSSGHMALRNLLFGVTKLFLLAALPASGHHGGRELFVVWSASAALSLVFVVIVQMRHLRHQWRPALPDLAELPGMLRSYGGNYLTTLGNVIPMALLPTLVVARLSATENAYFYTTWLLGGAFFTISSSVGSALFAEGSTDTAALAEQTRSAVRLTATLLLPTMLVFFLLAGPILGLFGAGYRIHGYTLLLVLTAAAVPDAVTNLYIARLRAQRRLAVPAAINMTMAVVALAGTWLLLPPLGLPGAGVAWGGAQSLGALVVLVDHRRLKRQAAAAPTPGSSGVPA